MPIEPVSAPSPFPLSRLTRPSLPACLLASGEPLGAPMVQLVTNALQYYLSFSEVATVESY